SALLNSKTMILLAHVKLWANLHMPWYHMVVGLVNGAEDVARVIEKLRDNKVIELKPISEVSTINFHSIMESKTGS
ncbi:MAG: hypothetical protein AAGK17_14330, partial [Pseudomonadota bacterium]